MRVGTIPKDIEIFFVKSKYELMMMLVDHPFIGK